MAVVYRNSSSTNMTAANTTVSVNTPTSTQTGDLLILTGILAPNVTSPSLSGWTQVENSTDGASDTVLTWTKTATSGDAGGGGSAAPSWTGSAKGCFVMSAYGGVASVDTHGIAVYTASSSPTSTATVTPSATGEVAFCYFADRESTSAASITTGWTAGSGLTSRAFVNNSGSASAVWSSIAHMDTNGTTGSGAQSYQATPSTAQSHSQAGLIFLVPSVTVVQGSASGSGSGSASSGALVLQQAATVGAAAGAATASAVLLVKASAAGSGTSSAMADGHVASFIVPRPFFGTVARPNTGVVTRPFTGVVARPEQET